MESSLFSPPGLTFYFPAFCHNSPACITSLWMSTHVISELPRHFLCPSYIWQRHPALLMLSYSRGNKHCSYFLCFLGGSDGKVSAYNAGDLGSIPGLGRSPRGGHGNPLQYSCLENSMDWGAWWATVHGVAKSWTWLRDFTSLMFYRVTHRLAPTADIMHAY